MSRAIKEIARQKIADLVEDKGSVSVILAMGAAVLLGFTAMVADVGLYYVADNRLSNGVDAAALAGARDLWIGVNQAEATAREYALRNGLKPEEISIQFAPGGSTIAVTGRRNMPHYLGRILLGEGEVNLERRANAVSGNIQGMRGVAPLGIQEMDFVFGERYTLKIAAGDSYDIGLGSGNYGALALGNPGASTYEHNLRHGYQGTLSIGDIVNTQTGNISNPTKRAIDFRIQNSLSHNIHNVPKGCPRVLFVPVFEPHETSSNQVKSIRIVGFAAFWVEEVVGQGRENQIRGYFLRMAAEGEIGVGGADYGLIAVRLTD